MSVLKTEPVAAAGGGAGAFMLVVAYLVSIVLPSVPLPVQGAITVLVAGPVIAGVVMLARRFSFSENTMREAGLDPAAVARNAADPSVDRCTAGEEKKIPAPRRTKQSREPARTCTSCDGPVGSRVTPPPNASNNYGRDGLRGPEPTCARCGKVQAPNEARAENGRR